jgi:predicted nuclease of predicted toxin-antitoxin system
VKFKVDENLPDEFVALLSEAMHDTMSVNTEGLQGKKDHELLQVCAREGRILITLDLDFADIRAYPPQHYPGFIVLRVARQDKENLIQVFKRAIPLIGKEPLEQHLWIVEETRIRIRAKDQYD